MKKLFLIIVMTGLIMSCSKQVLPDKPVIMVSILPQKYFVERIAGDKVDVKVMIPPGASPATYEPAPSDVINLHKASAYFRIGYIGFELSKMEDIGGLNKKMKIYDCSEGVELIYGDHEHEEAEHDNEEDDHGHSGVNPHIWLSPKAVKIIADNILKGLEETDPQNIEFFRKNHKAFTSDLEKLDMEIGVMLKDVPNRKFIVYHPAWSYFAHDYGLEEIPVEINGKEPSAGAIKNLIDKARAEDIKVVFVQKQFDRKLAENIAAETGGRVIQLDPLEEKWFDNMIVIARNFQFELK
ncbi:MAG: zinc ABC transporter substrate-binding protein [Candidatus Delongbacteria bacterium]|nr:zinc ABC transporter substrate-binding protein [Candidatus Delongbacteria bacterium]MDD4205135.1 zinc ABC transporter substrate-binding protein [Candidatus Delongbacteria bacterium]